MSAARSLAGYRAADTRRERDEFAEANIPGALLPLWNRVKLNFRGSPEHRAEQFIQYAHDHEDEGMEAVVDSADRKLEAMLREHERRERSGGFATPSALLIGLGLAAIGYVVYRAVKKKNASPAPSTAHHAGAPAHAFVAPAWPSAPWPAPPNFARQHYYAWEGAYA